MGIFKNTVIGSLKSAFSKTRENLSSAIGQIFQKQKIDEQDIEEIENILLQSDFGIDFTSDLIDELKKQIKKGIQIDQDYIKNEIKKIFIERYQSYIDDNNKLEPKKKIIILIGINGAGKTTTLAKLANYYKNEGNSVIIGSCDTFRAAANEQLKTWAQLAEVKIINDFSTDPSAVAYETIKKSIENNFDVALIDTAGRLHTNINLIEELQKILKTINKINTDYSTEVFLVIDGNSGQNSRNQLSEFSKKINITGIVITKLDGTSKGGSIIQLALANNIPIKFLGLGERIEDLAVFNPESYILSIIE